MAKFAKIQGKRRQDTSNASCEVFTNFRRVKMLDQSISFAPVVADKQVEEMVGHFCFDDAANADAIDFLQETGLEL
jgi:hypothetical protein